MNLPLLVQVLQRPQHVPGDVRYLSLFQSNLRFVLDRRRLALSFRRLVREVSRAPSRHVLHHDRQLARPSHQRAREIFRHVRARALRERGYLALDVRDVVLGVFEVDEFHRDGCVGANVARLVHLARGAATDLGEQDVAVVDHRRVGRARRGHRGDAGGCAGELDFGLERGGEREKRRFARRDLRRGSFVAVRAVCGFQCRLDYRVGNRLDYRVGNLRRAHQSKRRNCAVASVKSFWTFLRR